MSPGLNHATKILYSSNRHTIINRNARNSTILRNLNMRVLNPTLRPRLVTQTIMRRGTILTRDRHQTNMTTLSKIRPNTNTKPSRTPFLTRLRGTTIRNNGLFRLRSTNLLKPTHTKRRRSTNNINPILNRNGETTRSTNNRRRRRHRHRSSRYHTTSTPIPRPLTNLLRMFSPSHQGQLIQREPKTTLSFSRALLSLHTVAILPGKHFPSKDVNHVYIVL